MYPLRYLTGASFNGRTTVSKTVNLGSIPSAPAVKKKRVAIFDIDGTIFRSSLLIQLVEALILEGLFKPRVRKAYERSYGAWLDRTAPYDAYILDVVRAFTANIGGIAYRDLVRVAQEVVDIQKDRTYRFTRGLARDLKKRGYYLLAISHSPKAAADIFCAHLGFNKVYATMYELDARERFRPAVMHQDIIMRKDEVLKRAVGKEGLTLRGSVGVGDTESDISFLKMVDRPICFNPNKKLLAAARRNKWEVVVERKDVVYRV